MMKKILLVLGCLVMLGLTAFTQDIKIPLKEWAAAGQEPLILYISGDGGFNRFTLGLCTSLNHDGFAVTALNARSYFWDKKTPAETAGALEQYLAKELSGRKNKQWIFAGYSFGADVIPFVINNLSPEIKSKLAKVLMISPSTSTDFEIHLSDMFGSEAKRSMNVVSEVNRMQVPELVTVFGSEEKSFPVGEIRQKKHASIVLPGGHHYDGDATELAQTITNSIR